MIHFFGSHSGNVFAVQAQSAIAEEDIQKLVWLFNSSRDHRFTVINQEDASLEAVFVGPRAAMITPWSTNAVEITQNMGIQGIIRIEEFAQVAEDFTDFDPMLSQKYTSLNQAIYTIKIQPEPILEIDDIAAYNKQEGLALSQEEIDYLNGLSEKLGRKLTDSEVFGFSQVNSEHCRHKIFNGTFIIDGEENQALFSSSSRKLLKRIQTTSFLLIKTTLLSSKVLALLNLLQNLLTNQTSTTKKNSILLFR
jgi:phosphoribosylformylglycinamidine synthase